MNIKFLEFEKRKKANFINSLSGFKACNLIGTKDEKGKTNLAIISSAFHLGADPALLGLIFRPNTVPRDTLENIRNTRLCSLNHVNESLYKKAHQTSARYPREISEFDACDISIDYKVGFDIPFVKDSNIQCLLELIREIPIEENGTHMLIMKIKDVFLEESLIHEDGTIAIEEAGTITVSGLNTYHQTQLIEKLPYAKVND